MEVEQRLERLEQRFDRMIGVTERGFDTLADLQRETNHRLELLNERVDVVIERVDGLTERVDGLTERVDRITVQVEVLTVRVDALTGEVRNLNVRFDNFLTGVHQQDHADLRRRVERIERHLHIPDTDD